MLARSNDRIFAAFKRLQGDSDFRDIIDWLEQSLNELDAKNRSTTDDALLRQQQGAAQVLAAIVEQAQGKAVRAVPLKRLGAT